MTILIINFKMTQKSKMTLTCNLTTYLMTVLLIINMKMNPRSNAMDDLVKQSYYITPGSFHVKIDHQAITVFSNLQSPLRIYTMYRTIQGTLRHILANIFLVGSQFKRRSLVDLKLELKYILCRHLLF